MSELSYPAFPRRAFLAAGTVLLALIATAIVINKSGPSVRACAVAAARVMERRHDTVAMMELAGPRSVPACRDLTAARYAQALADTYRIEYGRLLPRAPLSYDMPPPAYKARSAGGESSSQR
jgi:hypothetical protein